MIFEEAGGEPKMQRAPKPLLWTLGLFNRALRETIEMLYEFEEPFVVDHSAFARAFGACAFWQAGPMYSYTLHTQHDPELRFSATLGHEPEVEISLV